MDNRRFLIDLIENPVLIEHEDFSDLLLAVFHLMDELARSGAAILMVSSELPELLQVADRILVMRQGRMTAELPGQTTQEEILRYAALEAPTA